MISPDDPQPPKTGDETNVDLIAAIAAFSAVGVVIMLLLLLKRKREEARDE